MTPKLSTEERLLTACGRVAFTDRDRDRCRDLLAGSMSIPRFLGLSRRHKVLPTVVHNLAELGSREGPSSPANEIVLALRDEYERRRAWIASVVEPELTRLGAALSAAGIEHAFTKGAQMIGRYPSRDLRQLNDVDLLARDVDQLYHSYDVLHELGYCLWFKFENPWLETRWTDGRAAPSQDAYAGHIVFTRFLTEQPQAPMEALQRVQVEVYTSGQAAGIAHLESAIWQRLTVDARGLAVPGPEDALLIAVAHNAKHGEYFLKDLNDIAVILRTSADPLDWDYLVGTAHANGLGSMAALSFRLVNDYYGKPLISTAVIDELSGGLVRDALTRLSYRLRNSGQLSSAALQVPMVWADGRDAAPLRRIGTASRELAEFVTALPLEYQTSWLAGPTEWLWRRLDQRRRDPLGPGGGRTYLIPIACVPTVSLELAGIVASPALASYSPRELLPGRLVLVQAGGCRLVLSEDYVFLPTTIPYKPSRAILGSRVDEHIASAKVLIAELGELGLTRSRPQELRWFLSQSPFATL